jgi:hypothetical protein
VNGDYRCWGLAWRSFLLLLLLLRRPFGTAAPGNLFRRPAKSNFGQVRPKFSVVPRLRGKAQDRHDAEDGFVIAAKAERVPISRSVRSRKTAGAQRSLAAFLLSSGSHICRSVVFPLTAGHSLACNRRVGSSGIDRNTKTKRGSYCSDRGDLRRYSE